MNRIACLRASMIAAALLAVSSTALSQEASDIVFLKGGGRVRGLIVEESPTAGVRVKLPDGTIKVVLAKDVDRVEYGGVKPAQPPPQPEPKPEPKPGPKVELTSLRIESEQPGLVSIDGGEVGRAPIDVKSLTPGKHRIRITYDGGGKREKVVFIREGEPDNIVRFEKSSATKAGEAREGVSPVLGGDAMFAYGPLEWASGGIRLFGGINLGLLPAIDFRAGGAVSVLGAAAGGGFVLLPVEARATIRFNLGPLYSIEVGAHGGAIFIPTSSEAPAWPGGGPDLSVLSFRFGSKRQFEITAMETLDIVVALPSTRQELIFQQSVGFSWVLSE